MSAPEVEDPWVPLDSKRKPLPTYGPVAALLRENCYPSASVDPKWSLRTLLTLYGEDVAKKIWPSVRTIWQYRSKIVQGERDPVWRAQVLAWLVRSFFRSLPILLITSLPESARCGVRKG